MTRMFKDGRVSEVSADLSPQPHARMANVSYLTFSIAVLLSSRLTAIPFPSILVPAFVGELSFAVWLTVKGVNVAGWQEKAERPP